MAYLLHIWTYIWKQKYILHHEWLIKLVSVYAHSNATLISQLWIPKRGLNAAAIEQTDYRVSDKTETAWALPQFHLRSSFCNTDTIWATTDNDQDSVFSCQLLGCLQGQNPSVEKQMLDLNNNILFSFHTYFSSLTPAARSHAFRESYRRKGSIFTCSTKYRSTGLISSRRSSLPFDFKTLWTLDEGSEKDNNMFKHSSIPKKSISILANFLFSNRPPKFKLLSPCREARF